MLTNPEDRINAILEMKLSVTQLKHLIIINDTHLVIKEFVLWIDTRDYMNSKDHMIPRSGTKVYLITDHVAEFYYHYIREVGRI